jgi:hypothetical protein
MYLTWSTTSSGYGATLNLRKSNGTKASPTAVVNGDQTGVLVFGGYDGTNYQNTAYIESRVDGTSGTNDMPGRLAFFTTPDGSASPTERMRITSDGSFLIGSTVASGGRLQISSGSTRLVSNSNDIYRVFTHRISKASNTTSTCAITFGNQGNQHASHIVEVLFAAAQDNANGGVGGRATFLCGSLNGVGNISEIQDIGTGTSFSASASGDVLTITATTTSNRNVVAWTVKVTSTVDIAAPTSMSIA